MSEEKGIECIIIGGREFSGKLVAQLMETNNKSKDEIILDIEAAIKYADKYNRRPTVMLSPVIPVESFDPVQSGQEKRRERRRKQRGNK